MTRWGSPNQIIITKLETVAEILKCCSTEHDGPVTSLQLFNLSSDKHDCSGQGWLNSLLIYLLDEVFEEMMMMPSRFQHHHFLPRLIKGMDSCFTTILYFV